MKNDSSSDRGSAGVLLVADIGATNARFGIADEQGSIHAAHVYPTGDPAGGPVDKGVEAESLVEQFLADSGAVGLTGMCLGLAGPVDGGLGRLTNAGIRFSAAALEARFQLTTRLVNDFVAVAAAVPFLDDSQLAPVAAAGVARIEPSARTVKAVLGPGTGLGMATVLPSAVPNAVPNAEGGWLVLPSEGGHCDLPATDRLEAEILAVLRSGRDQVPWEACLSGPGLVNLYRAVCTVWGCAAVARTPEQVTQQAREAEPVCHQTLEIFWGMLGCAAGNLALMSGARGGVLIAGGVVPQVLDHLDAGHFRRRFEERGALSEFAARLPTEVIVDPLIGLKGAARLFRGEVGSID